MPARSGWRPRSRNHVRPTGPPPVFRPGRSWLPMGTPARKGSQPGVQSELEGAETAWARELPEAAEGTRTLDLLHGKQTLNAASFRFIPAYRLHRHLGRAGVSLRLTRFSSEFWHPIGTDMRGRAEEWVGTDARIMIRPCLGQPSQIPAGWMRRLTRMRPAREAFRVSAITGGTMSVPRPSAPQRMGCAALPRLRRLSRG